MPDSRFGVGDDPEPETVPGGREAEGDLRKRIGAHADNFAAEAQRAGADPVQAAWAVIEAITRRRTGPIKAHQGTAAVAGSASPTGSADCAPEESAEERLAAEAVDRMIAKLDVATATVEAQLAELRRMRRAS